MIFIIIIQYDEYRQTKTKGKKENMLKNIAKVKIIIIIIIMLMNETEFDKLSSLLHDYVKREKKRKGHRSENNFYNFVFEKNI